MIARITNYVNKRIYLKLFLTTLASVFLGFVGYWTVVSVFPAFSINFHGSEDWNLLEGFASLLSLALLIGGLTFAIAEYVGKERAKYQDQLAKEQEKAKLSYEIYQAIYEKITDPEQEAARRWILNNIEIKKVDEDIETWYERSNQKIMNESEDDVGIPEGQKSIKLTLNCFDYIGFIADNYWEIDDDSLDWISAPIVKVWRRIGPYVKYVETLRKVEDYYTSAQSIGELCIKWREDKGWFDEKIADKTP